MNKIIPLFLFFFSLNAFSQKEANNWYFGRLAGIRFLDNGSVVALSDGQMDTNEGCSVISDADGNLLFYTDGRNVWDRNHIKMPNGNYNAGTGLMGDPSSTQSGIIVPKKGDPNIYYIFTVDEPHHENAAVYPAQFNGIYSDTGLGVPETDDGFNNGLNYSVVDLSVTGANGSIGDVVTRNVHLVTYNPANPEEIKYKCSEKITAVKNNTGTGFWVVTQFVDRFYSFFVDENGVNATPVITPMTPVVGTEGYRRNAIGYIKASPNGKKIAIAHNQRGNVAGGSTQNGTVYLYDFNNATGGVSNALQISNNTTAYGLEFSAKSKKLYVAYDPTPTHSGGLHQYNLESANIPASDVFITGSTTGTALQLGPDSKIYMAVNNQSSLHIIHLPEEDGISCDFEPNGVNLGNGRASVFGLPPFITSLFSASILAENTCLGDTTQFTLNALGDFQTISWDFGDATPASTELAPTHIYAAPGVYSVVATITNLADVYTIPQEVTIYGIPAANTAPPLNECDPENDGFEIFNLSANNASVLGTQNPAAFEVRYFTSQQNADENTNTLNGTNYTNTSNPQTIFARVHQRGNNKCYATTSFDIAVTGAPVMNATEYAICDDDADGNDTNGRATFDLQAVTMALVQDTANFTTTYYANETAANNGGANTLPAQFYNTIRDAQVVYARMVHTTFTNCVTVLPVTLTVNPLPDVVMGTELVQCLNPNGANIFNLTQADSQLTNGDAGLMVRYYPTVTDAGDGTNEIVGAYNNTSNPQTIAARVIIAATGCYRILPVTLRVTTDILPPVPMERCDDDGTEDGFAEFDLTALGLEDGTNSVIYYPAVVDALLEQNAIPSLYTNTVPNVQTVYARVEVNNECAALQPIDLIVRPLPDIDIDDTAIVCLNTHDFVPISAGVLLNLQNYTFAWSTGETTHTIYVNQPGTYTVEVTNITNISACSKVRTITVAPSDLAVVDDVVVEELSDNNTITIFVHPGNNVQTTYLYSLDSPNGPWQESNFFDDVDAGIHTVYVYDTNGCGVKPYGVSVLAVPKFFTPNGDGINDTWNIIGVNALFYENSKIHIFDRYGKLLADVNPKGKGWDGMYNGYPLPSTDYWYVVALDDGRTVKGHFSLIR